MAAALGTPTRNALHLDRGGGIEVFFRRLFPAQMGNDYLVPVLVEDGQVLPHVAAYFRWKALEQGAPDQTLRTESYVLLDFLSWLRSRALRWVDARDTLIVAWTSEQTHLQQPRLVYKRDVVFGFYLLLQQIGYLAREHPEVGDLVGTHPNSAIRAEKVERVRRSRRKAFRSVVLELRPAFSPARSLARPRPGRRRTPTRAETEQLFDHLLGERDLSRCVRDWLWARFQAEGGLRAQGVAGLSLPTIAAALHLEGIRLPSRSAEDQACSTGGTEPDASLHPLDALAGWPAGQDALLRDLDGLYDRGHEHLYLDVVEKGGKERRIEVPLRLIATTLKFYVWKHRAGRIRSIRSIHRTWQPPDRLWLSETRHAAICKGTISNRLQRAFKLAVNDGGPSLSGHRLRAFYASSLIERLYLNARADQGRFVDLGAILDVACELMGLSQRETLKHYLHQLHTGGLSRPGQALYVADRHDAELLRGLAAAMAQGTGELRKVLHDVAAAFEVPPLSEPGGLGDQDSAMLASQTTRARD